MPVDLTLAIKAGLEPVVDEGTRLLLLGSLPGEASLKLAQYYGHPRNAFWPLMSERIGRDLAALSYPARLQALRDARIGLWDVIARARRPGSLDQNIRLAEPANLRDLIQRLPRLRAIGFNGKTAARIGRRSLEGVTGLELIDLPSSSPAHTLPYAEKSRAWGELDRLLAIERSA
jgi:TDG/mug DNA glycosylase family protein